MKTLLAILTAGLLFAACGGAVSSTDSHGTQSSGDGTSGTGSSNGSTSACVYPPRANAFDDASATGCRPQAGSICQVSNGATVLIDGGVANGTETCTSMCGSSQYELTCTSGSISPAGIPDPDPSLGCSIVPVPTPSDALFYCCPCGS